MIVYAQTKRKEPVLAADRWEVVHTVELPRAEFIHFKNHLLDDYPFIAEHSDELHVDSNGNTKGLLVLCEGAADGILVNSEGSSYARYSAYLPGARSLLLLDRFPSLKSFCETMNSLVDKYMSIALAEQNNGWCSIDYTAVEAEVDQQWLDRGELAFCEDLFLDMLSERPEVAEISVCRNQIALTVREDNVRAGPFGQQLST